MRTVFWWSALTVALAACGGDKEDSGGGGDEGEIIGADGGDGAGDGDTCGGTPPVIEELRCENSGLKPDEVGNPTPTLTLWALSSDADADLSYYTLNVYFDDVVDGVVSTDDPAFSPVEGSVSDGTCSTPEAQLGAILLIKGGNPELNKEYEFGVTVVDVAGAVSEMAIVTCITPLADGSEGDGAGI